MVGNGKVSCIIPAYNEEGRIGSVLSVVTKHPKIQDIIVVDDGSSDNTAIEAKTFKKVKVIQLKKTKGRLQLLKLEPRKQI